MLLRQRSEAVVQALGLAVGVPACCGEPESDGEPEICAGVDALRADLEDLTAIEIQPGSLADFSAVVDQIMADVDGLAEDGPSEFETEVDTVQSTMGALTASVKTTAADDLHEAVSGTC